MSIVRASCSILFASLFIAFSVVMVARTWGMWLAGIVLAKIIPFNLPISRFAGLPGLYYLYFSNYWQNNLSSKAKWLNDKIT
jgi:hypothetical protein